MINCIELGEAEKKPKHFSQNSEDPVIEAICEELGVTHGTCVEIGVENGRECNTRNLIERHGWKGLLIDCSHKFTNSWLHSSKGSFLNVQRHHITAENINDVLFDYGLKFEEDFDLLSIDVDGVDYWLWKAVNFRPKIVVIEYNAQLPLNEAVAAKYDPNFVWQWDWYQGASLKALILLAQRKGYQLVYCESNGVNAFFVRGDLIKDHFKLPQAWEELYKPPRYGKEDNPWGWGHKPTNKFWVYTDSKFEYGLSYLAENGKNVMIFFKTEEERNKYIEGENPYKKKLPTFATWKVRKN